MCATITIKLITIYTRAHSNGHHDSQNINNTKINFNSLLSNDHKLK